MSDWRIRRRLDIPEVHRLLHAQRAMLEDWAETGPDSPERAALWTNLHRAGDDLGDLAYGGPSPWMRWRYWIRPFDTLADRRRWRWRRRYPCQCGDGLPRSAPRRTSQPTRSALRRRCLYSVDFGSHRRWASQ